MSIVHLLTKITVPFYGTLNLLYLLRLVESQYFGRRVVGGPDLARTSTCTYLVPRRVVQKTISTACDPFQQYLLEFTLIFGKLSESF